MKSTRINSKMAFNNRHQVQEFHSAFELLISNEPYSNIFSEKPQIVKLRYSLIHEEFMELCNAIDDNNLIEVIDALMDILYVLYGAAISYGVKTLINNYNSYAQSILDFNLHKFHNTVQTDNLKVQTALFDKILEKYSVSNTIEEIENHINELLVSTYYMCFLQGIDVDYCFNLVHKSNMSKLCHSKELAEKTVQWYKDNSTVYDSPDYKYNDELRLWIVFNKSTGKVLKSIEYSPVSFIEYLDRA